MTLPSRSALLLAALLLGLPAERASGGPGTFYGDTVFSRIQTIPEVAVDSVPTRLLFTTRSWFIVTGTEPMVLREGNIIRLYALYNYPLGCDWPYLICYTPPPDRQHFVDLGLLPAGNYDLELYLGRPELPGAPEPRLQHKVELTVRVGPEIRPVPAKPLAGEAAEIEVDFGPGYCPHAAPARVYGKRIEIPVSFGDCSNVALRSSLPPLAAGIYQAEARVDGQVYARREVEVISTVPVVRGGRFEIEVDWKTATGGAGPARLVQPPSADSALFYFFSPDNWELMVKVLDGCAINGRFWVYSAASTDVGFTVVVKDLESGLDFSFSNEIGTPAGAVNDIDAFPCP